MRQGLVHAQQAYDQLRHRFERKVKYIAATARSIKTVSKEDLQRIEQLMYQKEIQIQQLRAQHAAEIEKMNRKLNRRDETLKQVLLDKVKSLKK